MLSKIKELLDFFNNKKLVGIIILLLITVAIPLTVIVSQKQQEIRQRAAESTQQVLSEAEVSEIISQNEQRLENLGIKDSLYSLDELCPSAPLQQEIKKPNPKRAEDLISILSELTPGLSDAIRAYPSAKGRQKDQLENQIKKLSNHRKPLIIELMKENPDAALQYVLNSNNQSNIQAFSLISKNCVETQVTVEGELQILHADFFEDNVGVYQYSLITQDKKRILLYSAKKQGKLFISGMKIKVNGYRLDDNVIFDESDPKHLEILPKSKSSSFLIPQAYADHDAYHTEIQQDARGEQKVAVLKLIKQGETPSYNNEIINDLIFNNVNNYYIENSYGKINRISGDIFPQDIEGVWYEVTSCYDDSMLNEALTKADPDVDFSRYNRLILLAQGCGGEAGIASLGKTVLPFSVDGIERISVSWIYSAGNPAPDKHVIGHELGHNLGLMHSNFLYCGSVAIKESGCYQIEYGDSYDIMGRFGHQLPHMNAKHKDYLGWFNPSNIYNVSENGSYSIEPIETATSGLKAIKIHRVDNDFLFVEYRQPIGFDSTIYDPDAFAFLGGLIHTTIAGRALSLESYILDTTPSPDAPDFDPSIKYPDNPTLLVGSSFTDYASTATVTVRSRSDSALVVDVSFNPLDIEVSQLNILPDNPVDKDSLSFESIITNNGSAKIEINSPLRLRIDVNNDSSWDYTDDTMQADPLGSGESQTIIWENAWTAVVGNHKVEVCADQNNIITERDETNNCMTKVFTVIPAPTPTPIPPPPSTTYNRVFVTSTTYTGNLGGVIGADTKCQERADAARLGGTWRAWISGGSDSTSASNRLYHSDVPYMLLNGNRIATDWNNLTDGNIELAINLDELWAEKRSVAWTNTKETGDYLKELPINICSEWTSSAPEDSAWIGYNNSTDEKWSNAGGTICSVPANLYCFEQPEPPTPTPNFCTPCRADINKDGIVDSRDSSLQKTCLNKKATQSIGTTKCAQSDLNGDGTIDIVDTICVSKNFNIECPLNQKL